MKPPYLDVPVPSLALYSSQNLPGKKDATGAFIPEAKKFTALWNGHAFPVDTRKRLHHRRSQTIGLLRSGAARHVALFCHGWRRGIQFGFNIDNVDLIAEAMEAYPEDVWVTLYACSTAQGGAGGDGGFADGLRDSLCRHGLTRCRVDAHTTRGHTTRNPHIRRFEGLGTNEGGAGGSYLVSPTHPRFSRWRRWLKTDMRFGFTRFDQSEILNLLSATDADRKEATPRS